MRMRMKNQRVVVVWVLLLIGIIYLCTDRRTKYKDNVKALLAKDKLSTSTEGGQVRSLRDYYSYMEYHVNWKERNPEVFINKSHPFFKDRSDPVCDHSFHDKFRDNVNTVLKYSFSGIEKYLEYLGLDDNGIHRLTIKNGANDDVNETEIVIVTGTSSNHFAEFQGLVKNLRGTIFKQYKNVRLVFYNLGLTKSQLKRTIKYCNCEVRSFPIRKLPKHVSRPNTYAWKPVLIQLALKDFEQIIYVDTSFRFSAKNSLNTYLERSKMHGIQLPFDLRPVSTMTDERTFRFLGEEPCSFYGYTEAAAQIFIISRSEFTLQAVIKPLLSCALQFGCMAHPREVSLLSCHFEKVMHACHRFDQSVIGIIITRIFNVRRDLVTIDLPEIGSVQREDKANIFPSH
ncbi:hypothetical protein FSP39_007991 [Pinctada imbricata]|uniref:Uncharacterized protein n=1 Tax=Pinctada imbricata TaxID=66713 RepID=A0AA88Y2W9_PINIB|nr:hypothetical protein FSP39_007991 [Pinctada imbricata]